MHKACWFKGWELSIWLGQSRIWIPGRATKGNCSSYRLYLCKWHSELRTWTSTGTRDKFYKPKDYSSLTLHASSSTEQSLINLPNPRNKVIKGLHSKVVQLKTRSLTASLACKIQSLPLSHWSFYYCTQYYSNLACSLYHCKPTLPSTNFTLRNFSIELGNNLEYLKLI